jgi:hypothetical protein
MGHQDKSRPIRPTFRVLQPADERLLGGGKHRRLHPPQPLLGPALGHDGGDQAEALACCQIGGSRLMLGARSLGWGVCAMIGVNKRHINCDRPPPTVGAGDDDRLPRLAAVSAGRQHVEALDAWGGVRFVYRW